ncbi:kinase-like protein [Gymnopus androsaceus JB14]|uniref:Kinase-like protein n=1 Tax=Gymnopus androsaceus JB14 TaxID=1447944 RepID=A0A6A4HKG1_9AGAR|nr:kinase-like protein [Gymnopus androsaceus JB14]
MSAPNNQLSLHGYLVAGRYELLEILGAGAYGTVYKAIDIDAEEQGPFHYAIKVINQPELGSPEAELLDREIAFHMRVSGHENVVSLYEVFKENGSVFLLLELSEAGTLHNFLFESRLYASEDRNQQLKTIFLAIIDGLLYCHDQNVYHRDLKPENILCSKDGTQIQIADFGLSTDESVTRQLSGTTTYIPPEGLNEAYLPPLCPYSQDIWALGVILINIITRRQPWGSATLDDECYRAFGSKPKPYLLSLGISEDVAELLVKILVQNPYQRLHARDIRDRVLNIHDFFAKRSTPPSAHAPNPRKSIAPPPRHPHRTVVAPRLVSPRQRASDPPPLPPRCAMPKPAVAADTPRTPSTFSASSSAVSSPDSAGPITPDWAPVLVPGSISDIGKCDEGIDMPVRLTPTNPVVIKVEITHALFPPSTTSIASRGLDESLTSDVSPLVEVDITESPSPSEVSQPLSSNGLARPAPHPILPMVLKPSPSLCDAPKPAKTLVGFLTSWLPLCGLGSQKLRVSDHYLPLGHVLAFELNKNTNQASRGRLAVSVDSQVLIDTSLLIRRQYAQAAEPKPSEPTREEIEEDAMVTYGDDTLLAIFDRVKEVWPHPTVPIPAGWSANWEEWDMLVSIYWTSFQYLMLPQIEMVVNIYYAIPGETRPIIYNHDGAFIFTIVDRPSEFYVLNFQNGTRIARLTCPDAPLTETSVVELAAYSRERIMARDRSVIPELEKFLGYIPEHTELWEEHPGLDKEKLEKMTEDQQLVELQTLLREVETRSPEFKEASEAWDRGRQLTDIADDEVDPESVERDINALGLKKEMGEFESLLDSAEGELKNLDGTLDETLEVASRTETADKSRSSLQFNLTTVMRTG